MCDDLQKTLERDETRYKVRVMNMLCILSPVDPLLPTDPIKSEVSAIETDKQGVRSLIQDLQVIDYSSAHV